MMTYCVVAMTRSGRCAFLIGKDGSSLRLSNHSGERATWILARVFLPPASSLIQVYLLEQELEIYELRASRCLQVRSYTNGVVETYAMVMRLFAPLHAHPASHNRCSKLYQRKMQKGTTAGGSEPGPETSTFEERLQLRTSRGWPSRTMIDRSTNGYADEAAL
jgi:hypothetical protein